MTFVSPAGSERLPWWDTPKRARLRTQSQPISCIDRRRYITSLVIPTGIGASVGGFAGDAIPVARLVSQVADIVISHPNVLNGAQMFWPAHNLLYVEGFALDQFMRGRWALEPVSTGNRVGLVFDCAIEPSLLLRHVQAANAARATLGLDIGPYVLTREPIGVSLHRASSGSSWGTIQSPTALLNAASLLTENSQCEAVAVVASFPEEDEEALEDYRQGEGVDAIAGAEAIISHLVTRELGVPCAHAPALTPLEVDPSVHPKACAEELGYTFLPCVLAGLASAPRILKKSSPYSKHSIVVEELSSMVLPLSACGGGALLGLLSRSELPPHFLLIGVEENTSVMDVTPADIGFMGHFVRARTYFEAVGILAAHKAGIAVDSVGREVGAIQELKWETS